jgi:GC-rich sequence DNA-binding factor
LHTHTLILCYYQTQAPSGRTLLSFEDDLEGDVEEFRVKKSNHSRRVAKQKEKTQKEDDVTKDDAKLRSRKGHLQQKSLRQQYTQGSSDEDEQKEPFFSLTHRLKDGYIPDAHMIHAARKKREIARQLGTAGDSDQNVMLLNSARSNKRSDTAKGKSRLIREDENDKSDEGSGEGEDEGPAMMFGKKTEVSRQMQVISAMENAESGSDEERFIEEQINKGVKSSIPVADPSSSSQQQQPQVTLLPSIDQSFLFGSSAYPGLPDPAAQYNPYGAVPGYPGYQHQQQSQAPPHQELQPVAPNSTVAESGSTRGGGGGGAPQKTSRWKIPDKLVPITVDSLKMRLRNRLDELKETHHSHTQRLERLESDMETAEKEVIEVEERSESNSVDYQFYQQMRGYVRDLLSCLTEKV